jgi:hypothetical protein
VNKGDTHKNILYKYIPDKPSTTNERGRRKKKDTTTKFLHPLFSSALKGGGNVI